MPFDRVAAHREMPRGQLTATTENVHDIRDTQVNRFVAHRVRFARHIACCQARADKKQR